jgi:Ca-activated chloride channel family protein
MVAFRYERWDADLLQKLKEFATLMALFQHLLLQANGDVEKTLNYMKRLQAMGYIDASADLAQFRQSLEDKKIISTEPGFPVLTRKGERMIRQDALNRIFNNLKRGAFGEHRTPFDGSGGERLPETRPWQFGQDFSALDVQRTMHNSLLRTGAELRLGEQDFEVNETEHQTSCATVLLLDISHSMILYGEDRITPAKKVALALAELIQTRYPKDSLSVCLFGDDAVEVKVEQLPYVGVGPYHTNTRAALQLAQRILLRKKHPNKQIFMVTDGKPSAMYDEGRLYKNAMGLDPRIVGKTLEEAAACRRNKIVVTTFMLTEDPTLVDFVNKLTQVNRGRAYFSSPDHLGGSVFVDYLKNRKKKIGH